LHKIAEEEKEEEEEEGQAGRRMDLRVYSRNFVAIATRVGPTTFYGSIESAMPENPPVMPKHIRSVCRFALSECFLMLF